MVGNGELALQGKAGGAGLEKQWFGGGNLTVIPPLPTRGGQGDGSRTSGAWEE